MDKNIIIPRKKSTSIKISVLMFFSVIIMLLPIILYFFEIPGVSTDVPLFAVIICAIALPIVIWCLCFYFKQIFNNEPILQISENGICEKMNGNSVGLIKWEDIEKINVIPYMDNTHFIGILLKEPEKYIKDEKRLNRLNKQKSTQKWGHVSFSSIYFKKEFKDVVEAMRYYYAQHKKAE